MPDLCAANEPQKCHSPASSPIFMVSYTWGSAPKQQMISGYKRGLSLEMMLLFFQHTEPNKQAGMESVQDPAHLEQGLTAEPGNAGLGGSAEEAARALWHLSVTGSQVAGEAKRNDADRAPSASIQSQHLQTYLRTHPSTEQHGRQWLLLHPDQGCLPSGGEQSTSALLHRGRRGKAM